MTYSTPLKKRFNGSSNRKGFTLLEILMVIILLGVISVASLDVMTDTLNQSRVNTTLLQLQRIQNAIIGDINLKESNVRTSFGYVGDLGSIPTATQGLTALLTQPAALPSYSISASARFGLGWNGPYLAGGNAGVNFLVDVWGNALVYSPTASPPTISSLGADGVVGGTVFNQDIVVTLSTQYISANIQGFICNRGGPFSTAAQVELNAPNGAGVLTQTLVTVTAANLGQFSFTNVPMGVRSLTIYQPTKAAATSTLGPVIVTIDRPNYLIPCNLIDVNP